MSAVEAADGILRIAATAMSYAVKGVTTERGFDAGDFVLVAYGGAGPLACGRGRARDRHAQGHHAARARRILRLRHAVLRSALRFRAHLVHARSTTRRSTRSKSVYRELEQQGRDAIAGTSVHAAARRREARRRHALCRPGTRRDGRSADGGVRAQDRKAIKRHFDDMHAQRYGTSAPAERAEIVSLRSTVTGLMRKPPQRKIARGRQGAAAGGIRRQAAGLFRRPLRRDADLSARRACSPATASRARR